MKIVCPLNPAVESYVAELGSLGADEFYLGYANRLKDSGEILSRRKGAHQNFPSLPSLKSVTKRIHDAGKKVFIAINEHFYPDEYREAIVRDAEDALAFGVDGFIVTDVNLFIALAEFSPRPFLIASTGAHVMNSGAVEFYRGLGARRIILPRHLTPPEIKDMVLAGKDMEFEIFVKNEDCPNIDGLCSYVHGTFDGFDYDLSCRKIDLGDDMKRRQGPDTYACGACSLFELKGLDGLHLKIVGRHQLIDMTRRDVSYIKQCLDALDNHDEAASYAAFCKEKHLEIYSRPCRERCYR